MASYKWTSTRDCGQRLRDTHKSTAFRVSLGTYERALRIANALALAAAQRGFSTRSDEKIGRIAFEGHDASIQWRLTELLAEKTRPEVRYDGKTEQRKYKVPTGRLRITLQAGYREGPSFDDYGTQRLEGLLNRVFARMHTLVVKCWQQDRASQAAERQREEAARRREQAERIRKEQERQAADERKRRDGLLAEAARWSQAQQVRNYVAHIRMAHPSAAASVASITAWSVWALKVAADLDPTPSRLAHSSAEDRTTTPGSAPPLFFSLPSL